MAPSWLGRGARSGSSACSACSSAGTTYTRHVSHVMHQDVGLLAYRLCYYTFRQTPPLGRVLAERTRLNL